jgi:hypothetical protein
VEFLLLDSLMKLFGVTFSDAERNSAAEPSYIDEIVDKVLLMQADAAAKQHRRLCRGTHAKGIAVRADFEVFDAAARYDSSLAARLAKGIFSKPGTYPAIVRFANSDSLMNSDFKADVRSLSFSVDLTCGGTIIPASGTQRQDFSMQNASTLPLNDARVFLATMKVLTASSPVKGLASLSFTDTLSVLRAILLAQQQSRQPVKPYQNLRYWSTVPFRHGPADVVRQSASPSPQNPSRPLQRTDADALKDELVRHLREDSLMSSFDFALQFLDTSTMTYGGKPRDAAFWIENASIDWPEHQAPFHSIARLTLVPNSMLTPSETDAAYIDVTGNAALESEPVGSINRARWRSEVASRKARVAVHTGNEARL